MLNILRITEMVGISSSELLEIENNRTALIKYKTLFMAELESWRLEAEVFGCDTDLILPGYYEALVLGEYNDDFYRSQYLQTLHWVNCGLPQGKVVLVLSRFRKLFIDFAEELGSHHLAKGLCHVLDMGQSIVATIYGLVDSIERMKVRSNSEVARIQKTYYLVSAKVSPRLLQVYEEHQQWKMAVFNLSLSRQIDWEGFEVSHKKCRLAVWLNEGGKSLIPKDKLDDFLTSHEAVHRLGVRAINEAKSNYPENTLKILSEMEVASDMVSEVLLEVIQSEFIRLATADGLTGMSNRKSFELDFEQDIAFAARYQFCMGLILVDIDFFKKVNDNYGHAVGDQVLKDMAKILQQNIRKEEKAYRWGGEEFALLTKSKSLNDPKNLSERVRLAVEEYEFSNGSGGILNLTVSIGALCLPSNHNLLKHEIFALVDKQLYKAKENGRNQVQHKLIKA